MIKEFHTRYLAKATAMDFMAKCAGFIDKEKPLVITAEQIERDPKARRSVIQHLIEQKYLERPKVLGAPDYVVTAKAFHEEDVEPYIGELNIGNSDTSQATWLSGPMLKYAIQDLIDGKATIKQSGKNKVVVKGIDQLEPDEREFHKWLKENLGFLAGNLTNMSRLMAECLKLPVDDTQLIDEPTVKQLLTEHDKDLQKMKRTNDAIRIFLHRVDEIGGWDTFMTEARGKYDEEMRAKFG